MSVRVTCGGGKKMCDDSSSATSRRGKTGWIQPRLPAPVLAAPRGPTQPPARTRADEEASAECRPDQHNPLSGWLVLAVGLDPQGQSRKRCLADADDGQMLARRAARVTRPEPLRDVRPSLDVLAGGPALGGLIADLQRPCWEASSPPVDRLGAALGAAAADYDLVVIDSLPGEALAHAAAIRAVHYIVIPTRADAALVDGLGRVAAVGSPGGRCQPRPRGAGRRARAASYPGPGHRPPHKTELAELLGEGIVIFDTIIGGVPRAAWTVGVVACWPMSTRRRHGGAPRWWDRR